MPLSETNTTNIWLQSFSPQGQYSPTPAYRIYQLGRIEQFIQCKKHTGNTDSLIVSTTHSVEDEMKLPVV